MKMVKSTLILLIIVLIQISCGDSYVYNGYVSIPHEKWHADSIASFRVPIADTLTHYNLFINLRNTTDYPFQNLYLFIDITAPNGAFIRDTMECMLADDHGKWLGKGKGAIRDNRFLYRQNVRFGTTGEYMVTIQQGMRVDELKGVSEVGFRVELGSKQK